MIRTLVGPHFLEQFYRDRAIEPGDVPVALLVLREMHVKSSFSHLFDDLILSKGGPHTESGVLLFLCCETGSRWVTEPMLIIIILIILIIFVVIFIVINGCGFWWYWFDGSCGFGNEWFSADCFFINIMAVAFTVFLHCRYLVSIILFFFRTE